MLSDVVLVHRIGGDVFRSESAEWRLWQTCLRKVALGPSAALSGLDLQADDHIHVGAEAYRVGLEIICGLHSPLVGETEVFGQFKSAVEAWLAAAEDAFGRDLRRFTQALIEDAKKIRAAHLSDLGSQSYGSLLRKELRAATEVHVVGAGHLAGEILPWICKDGIEVHVHARDLSKTEKLSTQFPMARFHALSQRCRKRGVLIVAAPMTAARLEAWAEGPFDRVFDLRGDREQDRLSALAADEGLVSLHELMHKISANQELVAARRKLAFETISKVVAERARHVEYRPFGWEDVCA